MGWTWRVCSFGTSGRRSPTVVELLVLRYQEGREWVAKETIQWLWNQKPGRSQNGPSAVDPPPSTREHILRPANGLTYQPSDCHDRANLSPSLRPPSLGHTERTAQTNQGVRVHLPEIITVASPTLLTDSAGSCLLRLASMRAQPVKKSAYSGQKEGIGRTFCH